MCSLRQRAMEFAPTELLTLLILVAGGPLLVGAVRESPLPGKRWFALAYGALLLSNVCTIVESVVAFTFFNVVEHLATACFGILFVVGVRSFLAAGDGSDRSSG
jgi:hypothetical protein